jgi:dGTPase
MPQDIRIGIERHEMDWLSPYAVRAAESLGRMVDEGFDPVRTCFQRDRDRILHSKPFRRLKHKTQVFIEPQGDHYRTRMTHTLEVAQIARTIGRALRLNEDLIEAIALGHDVGHTPFGHAGEAALDEAIKERIFQTGTIEGDPIEFRHYTQSLRIVEVLDDMNLSIEVRAGIGGHSKGEKDLSDADGENVSSLEAAVVRIADRIAYMNHDLDDAVRSGMIPDIPSQFQSIGTSHGKRIGAMVQDVIEQSNNQPAIRLSPAMLVSMNELKNWLFENVYHQYPVRYPDILKAQTLVKELFHHFCLPGNLPKGFSGVQGAVDYVAGMTDRFAMDVFTELRLPAEFRLVRG